MHNCAAQCCQDKVSSMETVQKCMENCSRPLLKVQTIIEQEMNDFQVLHFFTPPRTVQNLLFFRIASLAALKVVKIASEIVWAAARPKKKSRASRPTWRNASSNAPTITWLIFQKCYPDFKRPLAKNPKVGKNDFMIVGN